MATTSSAITKRRPFRCHRPSPSSRSKRNRSMRKPHHRARGPHFPVLDQIVQYDIEPGYVVFTMPAPKRLRVKAGGEVIADTTEGLVLYESDHLPIYYFPQIGRASCRERVCQYVKFSVVA